MIDVGQFRSLVIRPALMTIQLHSESAENLLLGTALVESGLRYLRQLGGGAARGIYQMEPATHDDHWQIFLIRTPELRSRLESLMFSGLEPLDQLACNLAYATAMTRVHYLRVQHPLPLASDLQGLAAYWKRWYNTPAGKGTEARFIEVYEEHVT